MPVAKIAALLALCGMTAAAHAGERSYSIGDFDRIRIEGPFFGDGARRPAGGGARQRHHRRA